MMRKKFLTATLSGVMLVSTLFGITTSSSADTVTMSGNPIITSIFTADPSAHVWSDGRIYIYPSHDIFPSRGSDLMDKYHVFSSDNMVDWVDEGEILSADDVSWGRPEGGFMWAPDAAYKNGTYYFYFPHPSGSNWNDTWKIGVATSNQPASNFTVQGYIGGLPGSNMIDPAVFQDDDGSYYLYAGGGGHSYGAKLASNMISLDGSIHEFTELQDFHEASWVFKRNGLYYMVYADNHSPGGNQMRYATSSGPLGPWTNRGILLDPVSSDTTHGSVVQYKGNWYLFYHNAKISSNGTLRSVAVNQLFFNTDGTIQKVIQTDDGVPAVGPRSTATEVKYYDMVNQNYDAYTQKTDYAMTASNVTYGGGATLSGGNIENMHISGSYIQLSGINGGSAGGKAVVTVQYASNDNGADFKVDASGDTAGDGYFLALPGTGGWSNYTGKASRLIDLKPGTNNIVKLTGGMGGVNVSRVTIALNPNPSSPTPTPTSTPTPTPTSTPTPTPTPTPSGKAIPGKIEAESWNAMSGIQTENTSDTGGGLNVGWIDAGDWLDYNVNVATAGTYTVDFRVAAPNNGQQVQLKTSSGTVLATANVPNTGGWQNWTTVSASVNLPAGAQTLRVSAVTTGFNINWLNFTKTSSTPTPTPTATPTPTPTPTATPTPTPTPNVNLALGKTITESNHIQTYVATNANDGNQATYWEGAANTYPNTLTVDLGTTRAVSKVVLQLPVGWGSRTQTFSVQGSTTGSSYSNIVSSATYTFNPSANTVTVTFPSTSTRYVRLSFTANSGATAGQVSEFQIYQ